MITICFIYFRSLTLAHLEASLYGLRQQDFSRVASVVVIDNNTDDTPEDILAAVGASNFPVPVNIFHCKHKDSTKTHAWSTNKAVAEVKTPWIFFTRADYLLAFDALQKMFMQVKSTEWDGFVTSSGSHLNVNLETCELTPWRQCGPKALDHIGLLYDYTCIDTGVWLSRKDAFDRVGGLNESLTAWGHSQTHFQWKLHKAGTECKRVPEVLFYHVQHGGEKDLNLAHRQVIEQGLNLQEMWARYEGPRMY